MRPPAWHPQEFQKRRIYLEARYAVAKALRAWFDAQGFVETETPCLQLSPGMEPHLKAFETELGEPFGDKRQHLYLHTSPEFAMKKLLAAGLPRIFQLARCFRNEERSPTHHPEFTMLEWYRAGAGLDALMEDCEALLKTALAATGHSSFSWQGKSCGVSRPWQRLTVAQSFADYAGLDLMAMLSDDHEPDPRPLAEAARQTGISTQPTDRWEDVFFRIFLEKIEPHLGCKVPTFLTDYPLCMAALARRHPDHPKLAQRFELYVCGLELANAFFELNDSSEQRIRFENDQKLKQALYGTTYPIDEDFLSALDLMPDSSGIALGFDRLVMLAAGASCIDDVIWLPVIGP